MKEIQKLKPNERTTHANEVPGAQKVVGHDFAPRKLPSSARRRPRGMSFHTTFPLRATRKFADLTERLTSEQCRSPRHSKPRPTEFFGRTYGDASNSTLHDILCSEIRSTRLSAHRIYIYVIKLRVSGEISEINWSRTESTATSGVAFAFSFSFLSFY